MSQKQHGPDRSRRSARPGSNIALAADASGSQDTTSRLRRQRGTEHLHRLGARALFEFLEELGRDHLIASAIERKLDRYAELKPEMLRALGADRFPPNPLRVVVRRR